MLNVMACLSLLAPLHSGLVSLPSNLRKSPFLSLLLSPARRGNLCPVLWNVVCHFNLQLQVCLSQRFCSSLLCLLFWSIAQGRLFPAVSVLHLPLVVLLFPLYPWCTIYFVHCCDKSPNKRNLRREGFVWAHVLRPLSIMVSWQEGMVAGARGSWILSLRHVGFSVRKFPELNARTWNPFILFMQTKDLKVCATIAWPPCLI